MKFHLKLRIFLLFIITFAICAYFKLFYYENTNVNNGLSIRERVNAFDKSCLSSLLNNNKNELILEDLLEYIKILENSKLVHCRDASLKFHQIFDIDTLKASLKVPREFEKRIKEWLSNDQNAIEKIKSQKIIKLYDKFIHEEMIYNDLRGKRPQRKLDTSELNYTLTLLETSMNSCDFCKTNYKQNTAYDEFGRIETPLTYTSANTFKYDKYHSLIVSHNHNTLNLTKQEYVDLFETSLKWFYKVYDLDTNAKYAQLIWDAMPKSGASQVHTHLQASMTMNAYYGFMQKYLNAFNEYTHKYKSYYLDDFILIHQSLGLSMNINNTFIIFNLIPLKDYEISIIHTLNDDYEQLFEIMHHLTRIFIDQLNKLSFSMGMYFPQFNIKREEKFNNEDQLKYVYCRLLFRGSVTNLMSDFNGLDLYTSSVLGLDRFKLASLVFKKLKDIYFL